MVTLRSQKIVRARVITLRKDRYVPVILREVLEVTGKDGIGGTVGFGKKVAVLVVDAVRETEGVHNTTASTDLWLESIKALLDKAREIEIPIIYTIGFPGKTNLERGCYRYKHFWKKFVPLQTSPPKIIGDLCPKEGDIVIIKPKPSAFFGTQLESLLNQHDVDTLVVCGMATSSCVRATVFDAFSYNYRVIIPLECVADNIQVSHEVSLFEMDLKYADIVPLSFVLKRLDIIKNIYTN